MRERKDLSVALVQARLAPEDPAANRAHLDELLARITASPDLIILPETFTTGFSADPLRWAEPTGGESYRWLRRKARETGAVLCASVLTHTAGCFYNRLVWMRPDGRFREYDKRHVFRLGGEHARISPGQRPLLVRLKGWNIRPLVCYDLRFPVWCRNTFARGRFGYDVLLFVANWPTARAGVWRQLLAARAIENQAYVLGVNRVGRDGLGTEYAGRSQVVDPHGKRQIEADARKEAFVETTLSGPDLTAFRRSFNVGPDWDRFQVIGP